MYGILADSGSQFQVSGSRSNSKTKKYTRSDRAIKIQCLNTIFKTERFRLRFEFGWRLHVFCYLLIDASSVFGTISARKEETYPLRMKLRYTLFLMCIVLAHATAQEYKIITTVESLGWWDSDESKIVDHNDTLDYKLLALQRESDKKAKYPKLDFQYRSVDKYEETRLLGLERTGLTIGISSQHIASNDAVVSSKLTEMGRDGWELAFVTSCIESDAGERDRRYPLLITRYVFKKTQSTKGK